MSFSIGRTEINGEVVYMNGFDAMYANAVACGNTAVMDILEHRSEAHDGGPCDCAK